MCSEENEVMRANGYLNIPAADLNGNAGNLGPGEKEQRYYPYREKLRQLRNAGEGK